MTAYVKTGRPVGRPATPCSEATAAYLFDEIAAGRSVRSLCAEKDMPSQDTFYKWVARDREFAERYARAKTLQVEKMAEDILDISDDGENDTYIDADGIRRVDNDVIQRSRLRVDTRKWLMAKLMPKKYGERQDINVNATIQNLTQEQLDARLAELLRKTGIGGDTGGEPEAQVAQRVIELHPIPKTG